MSVYCGANRVLRQKNAADASSVSGVCEQGSVEPRLIAADVFSFTTGERDQALANFDDALTHPRERWNISMIFGEDFPSHPIFAGALDKFILALLLHHQFEIQHGVTPLPIHIVV
jgi:hypothetical protein